MTINSNVTMPVVRANMLEEGKPYLVGIHGMEPTVMKLLSKPEAPIAKMTETDAYVFVSMNGKRKVEFRAHTHKGPKFLVTMVTGLRGNPVPVRVTFYEAPKDKPKAKVSPKASRRAKKAA